jgi:hypothetical protein
MASRSAGDFGRYRIGNKLDVAGVQFDCGLTTETQNHREVPL